MLRVLIFFPSRYLKSPIVELLVGSGDEQALLSAHQGLLVRCPFFSDAISELGENPKVWVVHTM